MRILDIRETAVPLKSKLANSSFDFSEMTTSVVAVITDVVRGGKPVCGFAFNSTGRYACGAQMRARFIPRILSAAPDTLLDAGGLLDPAKILAAMLKREKAGAHSERSIAIGTIEVAVWDALAKIVDKPLHVLLAERFSGGKVPAKVFCYVGGGWYWPGQTIADLQDEMRRHLAAGYSMVKMKVGGLPLDEDLRRLEAVLEVVGDERPPRRRRQLQIRTRRGAALRQSARAVQAALVRGALRPARLRIVRGARQHLCAAAGDRREPLFDAGRREPRDLRRLPCRPRCHPDRPAASLRHHAIWPQRRHAGAPRLAARLALSAWRQPDVARHRRRFRSRRRESYPGVFGDFGGFADDARIENGAITLSNRPGIGFEGQSALYRIMRELAGI